MRGNSYRVPEQHLSRHPRVRLLGEKSLWERGAEPIATAQ